MAKQHKESDMQIRCVKWFRSQYPAFARLLEHPHNEGNAFNSRQQAIANAEGVTKGVADLVLHIPAYCHDDKVVISTVFDIYHSLAIELKSPTGTQSKEQKQWQRFFEASGGIYVIIRSYEEFVEVVTRYMLAVPSFITKRIYDTYSEIEREATEEAKAQFRKLLNKK